MPWKNQGSGGGPWGGGSSGGGGGNGGDGGPWGGGGGSGGGGGGWGGRGNGGGGGGGQGPNPPNFDDLIRRSQDRVRGLMPGGFFSKRGLILVLIVIAGFWLFSGFYRVEPGEQGVVLRFGDHVATTGPGLNFHWPSPIESVEIVQVLNERLTEVGTRSGVTRRASADDTVDYVIEESRMVTSDENLIDLGYVVVWRVKEDEAHNFLFKVEDPPGLVRSISESALREVVGQTEIAKLLLRAGGTDTPTDEEAENARILVQQLTQERLQAALDQYEAGVLVLDVLLQGGDPPAEVIDAFRDVDVAEQNADRQRNEADAYANRIQEEVGGQVQRILEDARAYHANVTAQADGQAARFNQVLAAYWQSPDIVRERLYIDTLGRVLTDVTKIILESDNLSESIVPYLPLNQLQGTMQGQPPRPSEGTNPGAGQ